MANFKIEKVVHNRIFETIHCCCVVEYFDINDTILQLNYSSKRFAKEDQTIFTVGMWKIKSPKQKQCNGSKTIKTIKHYVKIKDPNRS